MNNIPETSIGELLRKKREEVKLTLEEVHRSTKISMEVLRALEQDDIETFESEAYLKGFLRNYAQFLKLDLDIVMMTLERQRGQAQLGKGALWDIEETLKEEKLKSPKLLSRILVPLLIIIILLLSILYIREHRAAKELRREQRVSYQQLTAD
jgi:cytoskeletal protein RodZ